MSSPRLGQTTERAGRFKVVIGNLLQRVIAVGAGLLSLTAGAQISLDGSLGAATTLTGPDYAISADLGSQSGTLLLHSFETFNLRSGESATFSGPNSVETVVSRVTGGTLSTIDGLLRSEIAGADLYLLNPAGLLFGSGARLDVSGAFFASTADYLLLDSGQRISATAADAAPSSLNVAPVTAFGFLDAPAAINVDGSFLQVSTGAALALVGGDIHIDQGNLVSDGGRVALTALASRGEVVLQDFSADPNAELGAITIAQALATDLPLRDDTGTEFGNVDASGTGGEILLRADSLILDGGFVFADTLSDEATLGIDVQTTDLTLSRGARLTVDTLRDSAGSGGNITIRAAGTVRLSDPNTAIAANANGAGRGGNIAIDATRLELSDTANIEITSSDSGAGGSVDVDARQVVLRNGSVISTTAAGSGDGGTIRVNARESLRISGRDEQRAASGLSGVTNGSGTGGDILVSTPLAVIDEQAVLEVSASIFASGSAGQFRFNVGRLQIGGGARISSETASTTGSGGNIEINADQIQLSGSDSDGGASRITTASRSTVAGGSIVLHADDISIEQGAQINSENSFRRGAGDAGSVTINAERLSITDASLITRSVAGGGGNVVLRGNSVRLFGSSEITASAGGNASGGNIRFSTDNLVVLDQTRLTATAQQGLGGNISIDSDAFLRGDAITLSVSSQVLGNDGVIAINTPELDISASLAILPSTFFDLSALLASRCGTRSSASASRFTLSNKAIIEPPENWLTTPIQRPTNQAYRVMDAPQLAARCHR